MHQQDSIQIASRAIAQIHSSGAFLTVLNSNTLNTMTIGWALIGYLWSKPVFLVAVRPSRYTFQLIEHSEDFTVSVPWNTHQSELSYCGSHSGRTVDKFKACSLKTSPSLNIKTPILFLPGLHFECSQLSQASLNTNSLTQDVLSLYPKSDFHKLYFGEIRRCYELS